MNASTLPSRRSAMFAGTGLLVLGSLIGAAVADEAIVSIGTVGAQPGDTVRVPVRISVDGLIGAFDFQSATLDLTVADVDYNGPIFSAGWDGWDTAPMADASVNGACIFPQDQVTGDLPLFDLLVTIPEDAEAGSRLPIDLSAAAVWNYSFLKYDVVVEAGEIIIGSGTCAEDLDGNGSVELGDLIAVLAAWGTCAGCDADLDADGSVALSDLVLVLAAWGTCS